MVPVRLFINRKSILKSIQDDISNNELFETVMSVSDSANSIIRLRRAHKVRLSSNDINRILMEFKPQILELIFKTSAEELEATSIFKTELQQDFHNNKEWYGLQLEQSGWKIQLMVSKSDLATFRDLEFSSSYGSYMAVMVREDEFVFREDEEDSADSKAAVKGKYKNLTILGKGMIIYVLQRP